MREAQRPQSVAQTTCVASACGRYQGEDSQYHIGTPASRSRSVRSRVCSASSVPARNARMRSEEHTSELQSLMRISYAVFCLKKKKKIRNRNNYTIRHHPHNRHTTQHKQRQIKF